MIPLTLDEVAELCPGRLDRAPWADEVTGVEIDSRRIEEGDLFVAIGSGTDFRKHALARGAAATLVPDSAFEALAALGKAVRERSQARVVAITAAYEMLRTKRPHRPALSHNQVVRLLTTDSPGEFDPTLLAAFATAARKFDEIFQSGKR